MKQVSESAGVYAEAIRLLKSLRQGTEGVEFEMCKELVAAFESNQRATEVLPAPSGAISTTAKSEGSHE
jgi:hypothetical protein